MKALIIRYGAFGDHIHCSHIPRLLKDQGFSQVDFETNYKGYQLHGYNPFIDNLFYYEPATDIPVSVMRKYWQIRGEGYDKVVNLHCSLEYGALAMEDTNEYYMSTEVRRRRYENINFYDQTTVVAGYPELVGRYMGEIFYPQKEVDIIEKWVKKFEGKFTVMINVRGTGNHKEFVNSEEVARQILIKYPDAHIILTGGKEFKRLEFSDDRVTSIIGKFPFRQAALAMKYMSLAIGMESGIMVAATMWSTPSIQLMTATNMIAHLKYAKNDFSLQADTPCSPCHKGPYKYLGCPSVNSLPACAYGFSTDRIMRQVDKAYELWEAKCQMVA